MQDISELRPGCHSMGFVKTKSTSEHATTFSIVSSEWVLDIQVISEAARDLLVEKLFVFIMMVRPEVPALHTPPPTPTRTASPPPPSLFSPPPPAGGRGVWWVKIDVGDAGDIGDIDEKDPEQLAAVEEATQGASNLDDVVAEEKKESLVKVEDVDVQGVVAVSTGAEVTLGDT